MAEAGRQSKVSIAAYSAFLNWMAYAGCGRAQALDAVPKRWLRS